MPIITQFLDAILPGDIALGAPSASELNIEASFKEQGLMVQMDELISFIEKVSLNEFNLFLGDINIEQYMFCVERAKRKKVRLANNLILHCFKVYYTHPQVLRGLSTGSVPPFPAGNTIESDDWLTLEDVFKRGPIFREVP